MKKMRLALMLPFVLLVFTGCMPQQAIDSETAADMFAQELVYSGADKKIEQNFVEGKTLVKGINSAKYYVKENFFSDMNANGLKLTDKQKEELSKELLQQVRNQTKCIAVEQKVDKKGVVTMQFQVTGLNYVDMMNKTVKTVMEQVANDDAISNDNARILDLTFNTLKTNIKQMMAKDESVETNLEMKSQNGKWYLLSGQQEKIRDMYLSFLTGVATPKDLEKAVSDSVKAIDAELSKNLAA
jgi:hypothetical protein